MEEDFREEVLRVVLDSLKKPLRVVLEPHIRRHVQEHPELSGQIRLLVYKYLAGKPCSQCGRPVGYPSFLVLNKNGETRYCRNCLESLFQAYEFLKSLIELLEGKKRD